MEPLPDPLKQERAQISAENLELGREEFADIDGLIDSVKKSSEEEKLHLIWAILDKKIVWFLQRIASGSELHIKSIHAHTKAAIDVVKAPETEAFNQDLGHTLGPALKGFEYIPEAITTEGIRKILEFAAQIYEAGGRFERAYFLYRASYPEKYAEKIMNINPDDDAPNYHPNYQKRKISGDEQKQMFDVLMEEIKDDPVMQIDAEKEMVELLHEIKKIIDAQGPTQNEE
ncbi:MAG: hypothetical protein K0S38_777 [Candidatus Paceibacter sp.]|jgi:hypothetical protein|nr:hypothetical protein [Candidatus Paceibacter sp.]